MKLIDKYIYKEMILPVIFGTSLFTFIFLIDLLVEMMENILVKSIPALEVIEMISYYFPPILVQTIPMGVLLGVMLTYGGLSNNSEIIAIESIGIGIKRFLMPAFTLGLLVTGFVFFLEEKVVPDSYDKLVLITRKIAYKKPSLKIEEKIFIENIGDYSIYVNSMSEDGNSAENLIVFKKETDSAYPQVIVANKAKWENSNMILENANFYKINDKGEKELAGSFDRQIIPINSFFGNFNMGGKKKRSMMGISELKAEIADKKEKKMEYLQDEIEYHQKIAVPFSAMILAFLGVMLAVKNKRSGKGVSFGISLVIIFCYIMAINFGKLLANNRKIIPLMAMWYPNLLLIITSLILFIKQLRSR